MHRLVTFLASFQYCSVESCMTCTEFYSIRAVTLQAFNTVLLKAVRHAQKNDSIGTVTLQAFDCSFESSMMHRILFNAWTVTLLALNTVLLKAIRHASSIQYGLWPCKLLILFCWKLNDAQNTIQYMDCDLVSFEHCSVESYMTCTEFYSIQTVTLQAFDTVLLKALWCTEFYSIQTVTLQAFDIVLLKATTAKHSKLGIQSGSSPLTLKTVLLKVLTCTKEDWTSSVTVKLFKTVLLKVYSMHKTLWHL